MCISISVSLSLSYKVSEGLKSPLNFTGCSFKNSSLKMQLFTIGLKVKNLPAVQETQDTLVRSPPGSGRSPGRRAWPPVFLPEEPLGRRRWAWRSYGAWGHRESQHNWKCLNMDLRRWAGGSPALKGACGGFPGGLVVKPHTFNAGVHIWSLVRN